MGNLSPIKIPSSFNYISAFLTFACTFKCDYCINKYDKLHKYKLMSWQDWVRGLNRIETRKDLPVTLTGGEPTLYTGFYRLMANIDKKINLDLLTNGDFNVEKFMWAIPPERMKRKAKYASIRFSYHPGYSDIQRLLWDVRIMQLQDYSVGVWAVNNGAPNISYVQEMAKTLELDFRLKEFLDKDHGNYKYPEAINGKRRECLCKMSELLIAPDGRLFRCHRDLYRGENAYGHILDETVTLPTDFRACSNFGECNPCDIKLKFDRHQRTGWCSVKIKEVDKMR